MMSVVIRDTAFDAEGLRLNFRAHEIGHDVADGSPLLRVVQALSRGDGPHHSLHASA